MLPGAVWCRGERPLQLPTFRSTGQQHQPVRKRGLLKCTTSLRLGRNVACLSGKLGGLHGLILHPSGTRVQDGSTKTPHEGLHNAT